MITADEARRVLKEAEENRLAGFTKLYPDILPYIDKEVKSASLDLKNYTTIKIDKSILTDVELYILVSILEDKGYKVSHIGGFIASHAFEIMW
jgi:hypothetical protein